MDDKREVPIRDIWFVFWNKKVPIIIITVIGLLAGCIAMLVTQLQNNSRMLYQTTMAIAIIPENENGMFDKGEVNLNSSEYHLAEDMADAVIYVAKSNIVLNRVISNLHLIGVSSHTIEDSLSFSQYKESQIIQVSITWPDSSEGEKILTEMVKVLPGSMLQSLRKGGVEVVDVPESVPCSKNASPRAILIGAFIGFSLAAMYYLFIVMVRPAFYSTEYLKQFMKLPLLGEVVYEKGVNRIAKGELLSKQQQLSSGQFVEEFSSIACTLSHRIEETGKRVYYVTSTEAGEGKTLTVAMLGQQMALQNMKVLMVDFDIRHSSLGKWFLKEYKEKKTLNSVVAGNSSIDEAIIPLSENLHILTTYLESERRHVSDFILESLQNKLNEYDCVLIDTSPVGLVSDALYLNQITNQVIMVVRQGMVWREVVIDSKEKLENSGAEIVGCIFNGISTKTPVTKYYYRNYNYSYYASDEKEGKSHKESHSTMSGSGKK